MFETDFIADAALDVTQRWDPREGRTTICVTKVSAGDIDRLESLAGVHRAEEFVIQGRDDIYILSWKTPAPPTEYEIPPLVQHRWGVGFRTNSLVAAMMSAFDMSTRADTREIKEYAELLDPVKGNPLVLWSAHNACFPFQVRAYANLNRLNWAMEQLDMLTGLMVVNVRSRAHFRAGTILEVERLADLQK